jgi:hypothetical protein
MLQPPPFIVALLLLTTASIAGPAPAPDETVVGELRDHPGWLAADKCPGATIFLDESFGAGFTIHSLNQLLTMLRNHDCKLGELPRGSWRDFSDSSLYRALAAYSDKWIALSVTLTGHDTTEMVAIIRWSAGGHGEQHKLYFSRQDDTWARATEKDEHLVLVKKY